MDETKLYWIAADKYGDEFPPVEEALTDPDGLLAAGGELSLERLLTAYRNGIFPWYDESQPILWWSPNPRTILYPDQIHQSHSLKKSIRKSDLTITFDRAFEQVLRECAAPRSDDNGTWLLPEMIEAYVNLHKNNHAHSIECWHDDLLVGGIYGVSIGQVFFGESMFSRVSNASKICMIKLGELLQEWNYDLFDCQVQSDHLDRMGTKQISRDQFVQILDRSCKETPSENAWVVP